MKTTFFASGLVAVIGLFPFQPVLATDGTINFTGEISENTCVVTLNNSSNGTGTVTLPTVSANALSVATSVAGMTPFTIDLSECQLSGLKMVSTYFEPGPYVNADGRLIPSDSSGAKNVEIQLLNSEQKAIVAGVLPIEKNDIGSATETSLSYFAQYYATGAATPGSLSSQVSYTIVYD